jgi:hypothetical protein
MTETQAKSGGTGTSTTPVDEENADSGAPATGRAAVGRAVVPADAPSPPKFTRAPGMTPPPDEPPADSVGAPSEPERGAGGKAKGSAAPPVPVVTKGQGTPPSGGPSSPAKAKPASGGQTAAGAAARTGTIPVVKPGAPPPPGVRPGQAVPVRPGNAPTEAPTRRPAGAGAAASGTAAVGAARVTEAVRAARSTVSGAAARGPRRARLNLKRIDPWSVMKFAFAVSVVLFIVVVVATSVLYLALDTMGVWEQVNKSLGDLVNSTGGTGTTTGFRITAWGVIGTSMLIGAVNVVLFTALATLGAFIYNVCADLVGGVELTLAERD